MPPLTPDVLDPAVAQQNRTTLESALAAGVPVNFPPGMLHLDRALTLTAAMSGGRLSGCGCGESVIRNSFTTSPYGPNCTLLAVPDSGWQGYADPIGATQGDKVVLVDGVDATPYQPGRVVYLYTFNGYATPAAGQQQVRRRVVSRDGQTVRLDSAAPPRGTAKWLDGVPVRTVHAGDKRVRPEVAADLGRFVVGMTVYCCDGPSVANENHGYHAEVRQLSGGSVVLDRPAPFGLTQAALCPTTPLQDFTIRNVTLAMPANLGSNPGFLKGAVDLTLDSVQVGTTGDVPTTLAMTNCDRANILNAGPLAPSPFALNSSTRVLIEHGRIARIEGEEGSDDWLIRSLVIGGLGGTIALHARLSCSHVTLDGVAIRGVGGENSGAVQIGGANYLIRDLVQSGTPPVGNQGWNLQGDGGRLERVLADLPITLVSGKNLSVVDCSAPYIAAGPGTTGTVTGGWRNGGVPGGWREVEAGAV